MIITLLINLIFVIQVLLVTYFVLSWFPLNPDGFLSQIYGMLDRLFYPVLAFLRKYVPRVGSFDLSGFVLIIGLIVASSFLQNLQ